jgi:archaellum component FlaG (FlaF/FlaG flagellin family)
MRSTILKLVVALVSCGVVGYILVTSVYGLRHAQGTLDARLARVADNMNHQLPIMADPETRLDKVTAGPGSQLTYAFTLPNQSKTNLDLPAFEKSLRQNIINNYKTNSSMDEMRAAKVKLVCQYKDKTGDLIAEIAVTPKDF